jgi:nucleoid-associated protein YgaU
MDAQTVKSRLPEWRGHEIPSNHAPSIKSMAFHGRFAKLVMCGSPAHLRRRRPDAPRSAAAVRIWSKNSKQEMDMGLLNFVKSAGAKIFGATETAAAPPKQWEQEAGKHGLDVSQVEAKPEGKAVLPRSDAATEAAEKIAPATADPVGAATVQHALAAADKAPGSKFYTVRPGDTLWKIAEAEYGPGHGGGYHRIFEANLPLLSDPDKIHPGQVLRIPPLSD